MHITHCHHHVEYQHYAADGGREQQAFNQVCEFLLHCHSFCFERWVTRNNPACVAVEAGDPKAGTLPFRDAC